MTLPYPNLLNQMGLKYWQRLTEKYPALANTLSEPEQQACQQLFGLSDFIAEQCIRRQDILQHCLKHREGATFDVTADIDDSIASTTSEAAFFTALRQWRQQQMCVIAWRDLSNQQPIADSIVQVSELADTLINAAYQWLYRQMTERYGVPLYEGQPMPLLILGMGKLGGKELNFSSDIDLIFAYPDQGETQGGRKSIEYHQFFLKLAQKLITSLNQVTVDGLVFRVDMRLRPFGESGPLVVPFAALEDYYQQQGRDWERYAMTKARLLNPGSGSADELHEILRPFSFRRYIDFSAIDSLRKMKSLIQQEVRRRQLTNNIKLGEGGIREVEFIIQSFQLIRGGRDIQLQTPSLLANLEHLVALDVFTCAEADELRAAYFYLRKTEHCLQQFGDKQTQTLPDDELDQTRLACVMGAESYPEFLNSLNQQMQVIHQQFQELVKEQTDDASEQTDDNQQALQDLWLLPLSDDEAAATLSPWLTPADASLFSLTLKDLKQSTSKKSMGQRGIDILNRLIPMSLSMILEQDFNQPVLLLKRWLGVLHNVLGRTAYLELLYENPPAMGQLLHLCHASPWIGAQIQRFPMLLDELLTPSQLYHPPVPEEYSNELRQALMRVELDDQEQQMESLRQFKLSEQLKIAASDITGTLPIMRVSDHLTFLAEAIIEYVLNLAWHQMALRHGEPEGFNIGNKGMAVIGYGKLGGLELGYGSDLDLVLLHECKHNGMTSGEKPIENHSFYLKVAQRFMHIFNTKMSSGQLYEIDMRLRPSGNSGLLVCHVDGFATYQRENAWTWEHQALVRARCLCATPSLRQQFNQIRYDILSQSRDGDTLRHEVNEMRLKMRQHLSHPQANSFDLKQDIGGMVDIEFIVQFMVLAFAHQYPVLSKWPDNVRILAELANVSLLSEHQAEQLTSAYLAYRNEAHRLTLQNLERSAADAEFRQQRQQVTAIWNATFGTSE